jgi:cysteine desulfurase
VKEIYFDHSASTPTDPRVVAAMQPYFTEQFGNPLSRHQWGESAHKAIETARGRVANLIKSSPSEIIFTSTGSESNNLALKGAALAYSKKGKHIIVSGVEHESVSHSAKSLEKMGFEITFLPFDNYGMTLPNDVEKSLRKETIMVAVIHGNQEIGTIQPIADIGKICRDRKVNFFSDGVGTIGNLPVDVRELNVDLMSFAGNMFYGPQGVAGLFIRQGVRLQPLMDGGRQENYKRAGTHNVPGIVGLGVAAELAQQEMNKRNLHIKMLRDKLWQGLSQNIEKLYLTGHPQKRLPNHLSFCVEFLEGEALLLLLELEAGLAGSSGSICGEETNQASEILVKMGIESGLARGAVRFTLGKENTEEEVNRVIEFVPPLVERLRKKSVNYQKLKLQEVRLEKI